MYQNFHFKVYNIILVSFCA